MLLLVNNTVAILPNLAYLRGKCAVLFFLNWVFFTMFSLFKHSLSIQRKQKKISLHLQLPTLVFLHETFNTLKATFVIIP